MDPLLRLILALRWVQIALAVVAAIIGITWLVKCHRRLKRW